MLSKEAKWVSEVFNAILDHMEYGHIRLEGACEGGRFEVIWTNGDVSCRQAFSTLNPIDPEVLGSHIATFIVNDYQAYLQSHSDRRL